MAGIDKPHLPLTNNIDGVEKMNKPMKMLAILVTVVATFSLSQVDTAEAQVVTAYYPPAAVAVVPARPRLLPRWSWSAPSSGSECPPLLGSTGPGGSRKPLQSRSP